MADGELEDKSQKTEEPSERRKQQALEKGQIAISKEFSSWIVILAAMIVLFMVGPTMMAQFKTLLLQFFEKTHELFVREHTVLILLKSLLYHVIQLLILPVILFVGFILVGGFIQTSGNISFQKLKPKLSNISFVKGFSRLFSWKSVIEMLKAVLKIAIIGGITGYIIIQSIQGLTALQLMGLEEFYPTVSKFSLRIFIGVFSVMTALVIGDYLLQKFNLLKDLRMSKKEVQDEYKETEGDPMVKHKLRQLRRERAQKKLADAIPQASVIITNPTHYSVALRYVSEEMEAPIVVAKGMDYRALRIRELAKQHEISLVENPPLARSLYASVEEDEEIPVELYEAVADVIRYLIRVEKKKF